jgi:hypothetical protein
MSGARLRSFAHAAARIDKSDGSPLLEMHKPVDANSGSHAFCLIDMFVDSR